MMNATMELLPMTGWALIGAFALVVLLALAIIFFLRGLAMLHKAEEIAPHMMALEALKADIAKAEAEKDNLRSEVQNAKNTIARAETAKQYIKDHEPLVESMRRKEELLKTHLEMAKERLQKANEENSDLGERNNKLHEQVTKAQQSLNFLEARHREVQAETDRLQSSKNQLEAAIETLSKKRHIIELAIASLATKQAELERLDREIERLRAQHYTLTEQTNALETKRDELNASIRKLVAQEDEAKARCQQVQTKLNDVNNELNKLRTEREELLAKRIELNELISKKELMEKDIKGTEEKLETLKTQSTALDAEVAEKQGKCNALTRQVAELGTIDKNAKDAWQDLDRPVVTFTRRPEEDENQNEAGWLDWLNESLQNFGFKFPERTLRAFHTSLKCGEETPIVVLAGISGTGKSLLPELYAAAAGMNFLSVPVQPRWDGPQDVLGFYNYMEGRYKATELARFLRQADKWNNKDGAGAFPEDALNIVLLDEMNLARVEYYFADFLSKLEQRQGKDLNDTVQRKQIELFLECGAGLGGRSLCVDTNVFFIGTMNEDETTQMLSDKVIDRSNLLRFGRPAKLTGETDKGGFLSACQNEARITRSLWDNWNARDNVIALDYEEQLEALNKQFATVGRPFGHRIKRSVDAYMHAYPILGVDAERIAFADQIEMKVLPKLNGLELETPGFESVRAAIVDTITGLKDGELLDAFQKAANPNHTFFRWRGVMRSN